VYERTLLERLRDPRPHAVRRASLDVGARSASILGHLQRMLNTRQGESLTVPDYGVPDLTDAGRFGTDASLALEQALERSITRYEPRLSNVRVRFVPPPEGEKLVVRFDIQARLVAESGEQGVKFRTRMSPDGRIEVTL
jgi:type VI secretion system protein